MFNFENFFHDDVKPAAGRAGGFPPYNFIGGHNDPACVPVDELQNSAMRVFEKYGQRLATYNLGDGPLGALPLRRFLATSLKERAGMRCSEDEILLVSGSLQALDLVNQTLLKPGDTIIMEESTYGGVISRFRHLKVNIIGVPVTGDGMDLDRLEAELEQLKSNRVCPRYIYTIPTVHNPTGTVMPVANRKRMLAIAASYDVPIFEDDCYADLVFEGTRPPTIRSLDDSGRVIYCGSFSKTVAPALRVGYLVADWAFLSHALSYKTDAGSGALEQLVLADFCEEKFNRHVSSLSTHLAEKSRAMCEAVDKYFGTAASYHVPKGGIFIWVTLDPSVNTAELARLAAAEGVAINPGPEWSLGAQAGHQMRLCFGYPDIDTIDTGVKKLAEICRGAFGLPEVIANQ